MFIGSDLSVTGKFNKYVRPPDNASRKDKVDLHGSSKINPCNTSAASIDVVIGDRVSMLLAGWGLGRQESQVVRKPELMLSSQNWLDVMLKCITQKHQGLEGVRKWGEKT